MEPAELERARALDAPARAELAFEQGLRFEEFWALEDEGSLLRMKMPDGKLALPLWPRQELAALEAQEGESLRRVPVEDLVDFLLPELARQKTLIALFPVKGQAQVEAAGRFQSRLIEEWDEGDD